MIVAVICKKDDQISPYEKISFNLIRILMVSWRALLCLAQPLDSIMRDYPGIVLT
jgi:hypothetical protein